MCIINIAWGSFTQQIMITNTFLLVMVSTNKLNDNLAFWFCKNNLKPLIYSNLRVRCKRAKTGYSSALMARYARTSSFLLKTLEEDVLQLRCRHLKP